MGLSLDRPWQQAEPRFQGVFGNPLADPGLLGISSGASLGAVLVLILNLAVLSPLMVPLGAFMGAALISFCCPLGAPLL